MGDGQRSPFLVCLNRDARLCVIGWAKTARRFPFIMLSVVQIELETHARTFLSPS